MHCDFYSLLKCTRYKHSHSLSHSHIFCYRIEHINTAVAIFSHFKPHCNFDFNGENCLHVLTLTAYVSTDVGLCSPQPDTSRIYSAMDTGPVHCVVCPFTPQLSLVLFG